MRVLKAQKNLAQLMLLSSLLISVLTETAIAKKAVQKPGVIIDASREINMSEPDIIHFENTVVFRPGSANK